MRKHNYVVGYKGDGNIVYGKDCSSGKSKWAEPLTLFQAKNMAKRLVAGKTKSLVYKLVEV